jgi:Zn ribbon nucleic-acid-binding protein
MPLNIGLKCPNCETDNMQLREKNHKIVCLNCGHVRTVSDVYTRKDFGEELSAQTNERVKENDRRKRSKPSKHRAGSGM